MISDGVQTLPMPEMEEPAAGKGDHDEHGGIDPHVWMDPADEGYGGKQRGTRRNCSDREDTLYPRLDGKTPEPLLTLVLNFGSICVG